jgi:MFS family permease
VPNALSLVQAVLTPIISSASDIFQARKPLLVVCYSVSFIGCAIAPGAQNIYRVIGAQILIGFGFSAVALVYTVPSEILPRKWRPSKLYEKITTKKCLNTLTSGFSVVAQASINVAACTGACVGPLIIGAFTKTDPQNGWRNFFVSYHNQPSFHLIITTTECNN